MYAAIWGDKLEPARGPDNVARVEGKLIQHPPTNGTAGVPGATMSSTFPALSLEADAV